LSKHPFRLSDVFFPFRFHYLSLECTSCANLRIVLFKWSFSTLELRLGQHSIPTLVQSQTRISLINLALIPTWSKISAKKLHFNH
jgi:hypothetical protein